MSTVRLTATLIAAVLAVAGIAACGPGISVPESAVSPADPATFPRVVDTAMGSVRIRTPPIRVVVLDTAELDSVTLLGITPVGAVIPRTKTRGGYPDYLHGKAGRAVDVGPLQEPNLERIVALRPDLILSSTMRHEKIYPALSRIAPTIFTATTGSTWKANLAVHAHALGLERQASDALRRYHDRAHALGVAIAARNGGAMPSVSVVRFLAGPARLYLSNSYCGTVLADIGLRRPASQKAATGSTAIMREISPEQIDHADADLLFVAVIDDPAKTKKREFTISPVWSSLPAVRYGKVFDVADEVWMSGIGVQAAEALLADVAKATGAALEPVG